MFHLGSGELLLIFLIALLIFGPKRLPELGKALGQFIANLKKAKLEKKPSEKDPNENPPEH